MKIKKILVISLALGVLIFGQKAFAASASASSSASSGASWASSSASSSSATSSSTFSSASSSASAFSQSNDTEIQEMDLSAETDVTDNFSRNVLSGSTISVESRVTKTQKSVDDLLAEVKKIDQKINSNQQELDRLSKSSLRTLQSLLALLVLGFIALIIAVYMAVKDRRRKMLENIQKF